MTPSIPMDRYGYQCIGYRSIGRWRRVAAVGAVTEGHAPAREAYVGTTRLRGRFSGRAVVRQTTVERAS